MEVSPEIHAQFQSIGHSSSCKLPSMNLTVPNPITQFSSFEVTSSGHAPGEKVTLHVYYDPNLSEPIPDADDEIEETADSSGNVTFQVTMPEGVLDQIGFSLNPDAGWQSFVVRHVVAN